MIAKKITDTIYDNVAVRYELFENVITKDIQGNDVTIPKSVGKFTISQLQAIIDDADIRKSAAQIKLDAINALP